MRELGDEHRGDAVDGRRPLLLDGREHDDGIEGLHADDRGPVREHRKHAQHDAEAVEVRHRQADAIGRGELLPLADVVAVVEDVAAREHDALGEAGGPRGVLHVDHVVAVVALLGLGVGGLVVVLAEKQQLGHRVHAAVLLGAHVDEALELGELRRVEMPALLGHRLGDQLADDLDVVDVAERVDDRERPHVRLLDHVGELVALVDRVHGDEHDADLRGGEGERQPVGDVAGPYAQVVALLEPDGEQPLGEVVDALVELAVGPPQVAVGVDDEVVVRLLGDDLLEVLADGLL